MTSPVPKYFDTDNKLLAHLEWLAILYIVFKGNNQDMSAAYPAFEQRQLYWIDPFNQNATDDLKAIKKAILQKSLPSLDDFYTSLKPASKPKPRGKMLKDKKKRTGQKAFQKEQLGDDYIDHDQMIATAKRAASVLINMRATAELIEDRAFEIEQEFSDEIQLTDGQKKTLRKVITDQIDKLMHPDNVEAKLIDTADKNVWYMWGRIKRQYAVGETFDWSTQRATQECSCSKTTVPNVMKALVKAGAITLVQSGKAGSRSGRAAIYRREI